MDPEGNRLMRFDGVVENDPAIEVWFTAQPDELGKVARYWFDVMRRCGSDVREVIHDDQPTACVGDAAFAYVDAFSRHVNVGFFLGTLLDDPRGLLQGTGKYMRHVKVTPGVDVDRVAVAALIRSSYDAIKRAMALEVRRS